MHAVTNVILQFLSALISDQVLYWY